MDTPERFRARAEEAERLAAIVSYGRDKERLHAQATELRRTADLMEAQPAARQDPHDSWLERTRAWLAKRL